MPDILKTSNFEMSFKPESENGLLLYAGQRKSGGGDYVSIAIKDGFLQFKYVFMTSYANHQ